MFCDLEGICESNGEYSLLKHLIMKYKFFNTPKWIMLLLEISLNPRDEEAENTAVSELKAFKKRDPDGYKSFVESYGYKLFHLLALYHFQREDFAKAYKNSFKAYFHQFNPEKDSEIKFCALFAICVSSPEERRRAFARLKSTEEFRSSSISEHCLPFIFNRIVTPYCESAIIAIAKDKKILCKRLHEAILEHNLVVTLSAFGSISIDRLANLVHTEPETAREALVALKDIHVTFNKRMVMVS